MAGSQHPDSDFSDEELSPLDISFNEAADHLRKISSKLDNYQLLQLYAFYKQGKEGKCNIARPGWFDGRGRKKWDVWNALGDMPQDKAKLRYIELVQKFDLGSEPATSSETACGGAKDTWVTVSSLMHSPEPKLDLANLSIVDAARENLGDRVTALLKLNPDLKNTKDKDGLTALHWAADRNATNALVAALKGGCFVDATDNAGQTALHYAASCGHIQSTKILIEYGASLLKDEDGETPLDLAADEEIRNALEGVK